VGVRSSSSLRLCPAARGSALVLVVVCASAGAAVAQAAGRAPDPSPAVSSPGPDPYPAPAASVSRPSVPMQTQAPVATVVLPTVVRAPVHRSSVARRKPRPAVAQKVAVKPIRLPVHPAPGLGARVAAATLAFEPEQRVSRSLALAVALLVLVSAAFLAGAAREVAR
jgi:hypothetical protein